MKKHFLVLFFIAFIVPSVAFASWWNPFSWFNCWGFCRNVETVLPQPTETQSADQEKIAELQKQIDDLKNQQNTTEKPAPPTKTTTPSSPKNATQNTPTSPSTNTPSTTTNTTSQALEISDVNVDVTSAIVTISWHTNVPSESRLFLTQDNSGYESLAGINTEHSVDINALDYSTQYNYKITAITPDKKSQDDFYGSFWSYTEYDAFLGNFEDGCQTIVITESTRRYVSINKYVTVEGWSKSPTANIAKGRENLKSDSNGEVQYCKSANFFVVTIDGKDITLER